VDCPTLTEVGGLAVVVWHRTALLHVILLVMKYATLFILLSCTCVFLATSAENLLIRFVAGSSAIAFAGVGLGYGFLGAKVFLKKDNGQLSFISYILYWPYHLLNSLSLFGFRHSGKENAYDKIDENIYLGCRLSPRDAGAMAQLGIQSVLDLTCEFSEVPALRGLAYRCIPVLDTCAPTLDQLTAGAAWIQQQAAKGPVYVHCALGHGRSATFVAAYLLMSGKSHTTQEAVDKTAALRPKIGLSKSQTALLQQLESISLSGPGTK